MEETKALKKFDNLAKKLAGKYAATYKDKFEFEELYAAARMGIVKASRSYKEELNVQFITHAYNCVNNYIKGYIRDSKVLTKLPDSTHRTSLIVDNESAQAQLEATPATDDISAQERRMFLEQAISRLNEKQQKIIKMVFFQGLSYEEAAAQLGVSKQYANQLSFQALQKLKEYVSGMPIDMRDMLQN